MAKGDDRIRINRAPVLGLLGLAACAGEATAPPVPAAPVTAARPAPAPPRAPPLRAYIQEVDDLFRWLAERGAGGVPARGVQADQGASPAVVYTIPRVSREIPATAPRAAERAAYRQNLEVCLDGRFPAFCDHGRLTAPDASRVREAEYQANLVTCIDPEWRHLCRPELLPETLPAAAHAP